MKLQIKVPLLVITILLLIGVISGGMMLYFQRRASIDQSSKRLRRWREQCMARGSRV